MSKQPSPAISLITPTRNRVDLLTRTIETVRRQRLQSWEMIVVDDGDGSGVTAALGIGDARVRALQNPGAGQVDARNAAVQSARGEIIHLLDDDDRWTDVHHLEQVLQTLSAEVGLVYRAGWLVLEREERGAWLEVERTTFDPPTSAASLRLDNTLLTSGVAYPRQLHEKLGVFDREIGNYWDWDWWLRVTNRFPLLKLEPPAVLMSWRGSNTSKNPFDAQRLEYLRRLSAKHGLGEIAPKNHQTVLATSVLER